MSMTRFDTKLKDQRLIKYFKNLGVGNRHKLENGRDQRYKIKNNVGGGGVVV